MLESTNKSYLHPHIIMVGNTGTVAKIHISVELLVLLPQFLDIWHKENRLELILEIK